MIEWKDVIPARSWFVWWSLVIFCRVSARPDRRLCSNVALLKAAAGGNPVQMSSPRGHECKRGGERSRRAGEPVWRAVAPGDYSSHTGESLGPWKLYRDRNRARVVKKAVVMRDLDRATKANRFLRAHGFKHNEDW
ncbi:hypothetical protein BV898_14734 [Hypsibius exemplaris]|uniref:Uncharacterized protein n=1 Tax=Hypsibius exemplaris TaxID=2072580 RepID=A0A9X6RJS4_HYPEX|nr:hypothetical protein BV898_14734 [Hypsibius exemplaris]